MNAQQAMQWTDAKAYDRFMGRWSSVAGRKFVEWLCVPRDLRWLDVGCGTGAFCQTILDACNPGELVGVDSSEAQLVEARSRFKGRPATFMACDALSLPFEDAAFDLAVSGLVFNFVSEPVRMVREMKRVVKPRGWVAAYVWDFGGGGSISQHILSALEACSPSHAQAAANLQRAEATGIEALTRVFAEAGLDSVQAKQIEIKVRFESFDDYWSANTGFASPPARQIAALAPDVRRNIELQVRETLPSDPDGAIEYTARANAVRGKAPP